MADPYRGVYPGPADAFARFRAAEERLYPLAVFDVERYQRGTALCALLLDDLRATSHDLAAVQDRCLALVTDLPELADRAGLDLRGLDPATLVDAAAAARYRELEPDHLRAARAARIASARESGQEWLVDEPAPEHVMAGIFRRVELHLATGARVISTVEVGTSGRPTTYTLAVVPDGETEDQARSETFTTRDAWQEALEEHRSRFSGRP